MIPHRTNIPFWNLAFNGPCGESITEATEEECFFKPKFEKQLKRLEEKKEGDRAARKVGEDKDAEDGSNSSVMNQVSKAEISRVLEAMSKTLSI